MKKWNVCVSNEIECRAQLADLCNARGLVGFGVELGTHRGEFAGAFLHRWQGKKLYLVDQYLPTRDFPHPRDQDRQIAHCVLANHKERIELLELHTVLALRQIAEPLDFIYHDAGHLEWELAAEMEEGFKRLVPGGMGAGHDYSPHSKDVCRAVNAFSAKHQVKIYLTQDLHEPWSWFYFKGEA